MRTIILSAALAASALVPVTLADAREGTGKAPARTTICGWVVNPTPGNWWITDRYGDWTIATQGSEGAEGMDNIPDLTEREWVNTNGTYGYGCGCMTATVDQADKSVQVIHSFKQKPIATCRADPNLPDPE